MVVKYLDLLQSQRTSLNVVSLFQMECCDGRTDLIRNTNILQEGTAATSGNYKEPCLTPKAEIVK